MHSHFSLKVRGVPKSIFPASLCREYSRLDFVVGKVARSIIANIAIAFSGVKFFVQDNILKHRRFSQIKYTTSEDSPGSVFKLIFYSRKEDVKVLRQSGYGLRKLKSTKKASTHCFKATPLENRFYSHGGFMGLATELILDSGWRGILKRSEEDVYLKCAEILSFYGIDMDFIPEEISDPKCIEEIMLALENTPTLSAFGCIRAAESEEYKQAEKPIIEWDIWIDGGGSNSIEGRSEEHTSELQSHC